MTVLNTTGPAINGLDSLVREIASLRQRVDALEKQNSRYVSIGTSWRIQVSGTAGTSVLQAVRTVDGSTTQIAP